MQKPVSIAVIVVLLGIEGIKLIIEGLGFILSSGPELFSLFFKIGIGLLIVGSLSSVSSLGIWVGRNWGRILGIMSAIFIGGNSYYTKKHACDKQLNSALPSPFA